MELGAKDPGMRLEAGAHVWLEAVDAGPEARRVCGECIERTETIAGIADLAEAVRVLSDLLVAQVEELISIGVLVGDCAAEVAEVAGGGGEVVTSWEIQIVGDNKYQLVGEHAESEGVWPGCKAKHWSGHRRRWWFGRCGIAAKGHFGVVCH